MASFLLPYANDRLLMMWQYPDGIHGKRIETRSKPSHAPTWIPHAVYKGKERIFLNDAATVAWVANLNSLELHVPFDRYDRTGYPTQLFFDLDPMSDDFELVLEVAIQLRSVLGSLGLESCVKTSGGTGLHIHVPFSPNTISFKDARKINAFLARYVHDTMPEKVTLERVVEKRGNKLYFDYLQLWAGRTSPVPYSVRARPQATVATPVSWNEVERGFHPVDFTIFNVPDRLHAKGDLLQVPDMDRNMEAIQNILTFLDTHPLHSS